MSDSAKRIEASTLRSSGDKARGTALTRMTEEVVKRYRDATEDGQECRGIPPVGSAHRERRCAPRWFETLLQFKGFGGGVPPNTETAAVNPRAGVA